MRISPYCDQTTAYVSDSTQIWLDIQFGETIRLNPVINHNHSLASLLHKKIDYGVMEISESMARSLLVINDNEIDVTRVKLSNLNSAIFEFKGDRFQNLKNVLKTVLFPFLDGNYRPVRTGETFCIRDSGLEYKFVCVDSAPTREGVVVKRTKIQLI